MILNETQKELYKRCIFLKEDESQSTDNSENKEENKSYDYIALPTAIAYKNVKVLDNELYEKHKEVVNTFLLMVNSELNSIYNSRNLKFYATTESTLKVTETKINVVVYGMVEKNGKKIEKTLSISAPVDNPRDVTVNRKNV